MILVYQPQLMNAIKPSFRQLIEKDGLSNINCIDAENLRNRITTPNTPVDKKVSHFVKNGILIPDPYLIDLLVQEFQIGKTNVLVNFPRNITQLYTLNYHLKLFNDTIDKIIHYTVNDFETLFEMAKSNYGKIYNDTEKEQSIEALKRQVKSAKQVINHLKNVLIQEIDFLRNPLDFPIITKN